MTNDDVHSLLKRKKNILFTVTLSIDFSHFFFSDFQYEAHEELKDFSSAQSDCEERGGDLAKPSSAEAEAKILEAIATQEITKWGVGGGYHAVWVNLQEDNSNKLVPKQSYLNYHKGEPNAGSERCVFIEYHPSSKKWWDAPCEWMLPYVCQTDPGM